MSTQSFEKALSFVLDGAYGWRGEGIVSTDPQDSGGLTKYGISERQYPQVANRDFSRQDASAIYLKDYWTRTRCDDIPAALAVIQFDCAVNQGPPTAVRMLQRALKVRDDGVIGPETLAAIEHADMKGLIMEFIARRAYQYCLVPQVMRDGLGWYRRLSACHQVALDLS